MNVSIVEKTISEIEVIRPLWEQLNSIHLDKSVHFKSRYEKFTFDKRINSILEKAEKSKIKFDVLLDNDNEKYVGYCISSIEDKLGEIESIYIDSEYRKFKLGGKLMESALSWFALNKIDDIEINVVYANDDALPFYERYGFYPGNYILRKKAGE